MKPSHVKAASEVAEQHAAAVRAAASMVGDQAQRARKQAQLGARVLTAYVGAFYRALTK